MRKKNIWRNNSWKFSKFGENHQLPDQRSSAKPKQNECSKENCTEVHPRLLKTRRTEKIMKATREKRQHDQRTMSRMNAYFSSETLGARRQWTISELKRCQHPLRLFQNSLLTPTPLSASLLLQLGLGNAGCVCVCVCVCVCSSMQFYHICVCFILAFF